MQLKLKLLDIGEVLFQIVEQNNDPKIKNEAESLENHGIENFES
jgi:hypothetical protein